MNIAFLSSLNPDNSDNWFNLLYTSLQKKYKLTWIGKDVFMEIEMFHKSNFGNHSTFIPENYAILFGKLISDQLQKEYYDVIMYGECFWTAYLITNIPLIYIGDIFGILKNCIAPPRQEFTEYVNQLEMLAIRKSDKIIYSSESAKQNAIQNYNACIDKVEVIKLEIDMIGDNLNLNRKDQPQVKWDEWVNITGRIIEQVIDDNQPEFYIPVYAINMKERVERRQHIVKEFQNRKEFEFNLVEASVHSIGAVGLWKSMIRIIEKAKDRNDDVIIICEDDHYFTENYSSGLLLKEIIEAYMQKAEVLSGGVGGFGHAIPVGFHRYKVDWFWCTQLIVIFSSFFDKMLNYSFKDTDTADGVISQLANNKMVIYPFISEQKDFGYSDVTLSNMEQKGMIREHFQRANRLMEYIESKKEY